jgi:hypothetical protein
MLGVHRSPVDPFRHAVWDAVDGMRLRVTMNGQNAIGEDKRKPARNISPPPDEGNGQERNRLEIIRVASREDCHRAIGVLMERGLLAFASTAVNQWSVRTDVVRALRQNEIPFEWLTENS